MSPEWKIPRAVIEAQAFKSEKEIERLRGVLSAIAEAKGFDNIGAWARNLARTELVKSYGVLPTDRENGVMPNVQGEGRERGILREASSGEAATSTDGLGG